MEMEGKKTYCPILDVDGVISGGKQFDLDITLPEDNRDVIYGVVKNCFKEPVTDAVVKLVEVVYEHGKEERRAIGHTFTDKEGEFVFGPLCPGKEYSLQIWVNDTKKVKICAKCHHEGRCLKGNKHDKCDCFLDDRKEHFDKHDKKEKYEAKYEKKYDEKYYEKYVKEYDDKYEKKYDKEYDEREKHDKEYDEKEKHDKEYDKKYDEREKCDKKCDEKEKYDKEYDKKCDEKEKYDKEYDKKYDEKEKHDKEYDKKYDEREKHEEYDKKHDEKEKYDDKCNCLKKEDFKNFYY